MERIMSEQSAVSDQQSANDARTLADSGFFWRERDGVIKVLVCKPLEDAGFANGFSTRLGGVSAFSSGNDLNLAGFNEDIAENIYENRRRFLAAFNGDPRLALVWQVHGDTVKTVKTLDDIGDSDEKADAVISNLKGVLAGAKTADCVPVLIGDTKTGAYAAVHAGWRGTVLSIVKKAVAELTRVYDSAPYDLMAAIGPAAGCENYEVGQDVMDDFQSNFGDESEKYFTLTREAHAFVDLHLANRDQLLDAGVSADQIFTAPYCTMERPDLFFSYRLEKRTFGKTGRLLSVVGRL